MEHLVIDLETIADPAIPCAADKFPPPAAHRIVEVGVLSLVDYAPQTLEGLSARGDEPAMLAALVDAIGARRPQLVTWNGRGFDLPVVVMRCLKHGIALPERFVERFVARSGVSDDHFDVMDYLSGFGAARFPSMDHAAKLVGLPGKMGTSGGDVARLHAEGKRDDIRRYCLTDVAQTAILFLRAELLRGRLTPSACRALVARMETFFRTQADVKELVDVLDRRRAEDAPLAAPGGE